MTEFSDPDILVYLFLLRLSLCILSLFLVRQHRALLLRRCFSKLDVLLFALDAVCAAQPPIFGRFGKFDAPGVPASIGVAMSTTVPLYLWIGRWEKQTRGAVAVSLVMLFQRVTTFTLWYNLFPLQAANAMVAAKCVWTSLQGQPTPRAPRAPRAPHVV